MPTLAEACALLAVNRVTLRKWLARLKIRPEQDEYDTRFWRISDDAVEAIRTARAKMPSVRSPQPNLGEQTKGSIIEPIRRQETRQQPLSASVLANEVPDGMMGRHRAGKVHGIPSATVIDWANNGLLECDPGVYGNRGRPTEHPLTRRGLHQLWERAHTDARWRDCADCPHAS